MLYVASRHFRVLEVNTLTQANVSTVFVADRIKEIPFSNRTYIHHLLKLEDRALGMPVPKPRGMYGGYDPVLLHPVTHIPHPSALNFWVFGSREFRVVW